VTIIGAVLIGCGVLLCVTAGIGLLRFPDTLTRANAGTKAAGLGVAAVLLGVAFTFNTPEAWWKMLVAIALQFATAPVAGHVIGRAAYRAGAPLASETWADDLAGFPGRRATTSGETPGDTGS
jgi:multicomponent Na+:H+ antiporter subunit G